MIQMKYFGIGPSKSGTSSLQSAFIELGFSSRHYLSTGAYKHMLSGTYSYDFVCDMPTYWKFPELDSVFGDAKFIYTKRDMNDWISSCKRYWNIDTIKSNPDFNVWWKEFFITEDLTDTTLTAAYDTHLTSVNDFFKNRESDLLILDMSLPDAEKWELLCDFTKTTVPNIPFPHRNHNQTYPPS